MATLTSVKSGYWSDPTVWDLGVVPANGDSVTIAAGHTVIFNADQSSFTNGLAGLTINGTLKIPSQQEDSNMPNFVCLKVNANIAGTGSFLIGSPTYPITYPQSAKVMLNGTITVATFNVYGEERLPTFDYLAQNAAAGQPNIVLTNGMPLRAGDQIAIGINGSGSDYLYTVSSYDSSTKTVTLSTNLTTARTGGFPYGCLVLLLTRQIILSKYGSNSVAILSGSGRNINGAQFIIESGAAIHSNSISIINSTVVNSSFMLGTNARGFYNLYSTGNTLTVTNCVFYGMTSGFTENGASNVENCAAVYMTNGLHTHYNVTALPVSYNNIHLQNAPFLYKSHSENFQIQASNITIKNAALTVGPIEGAYLFVDISNVTIVNASTVINFSSSTGGFVEGEVRNLTIYTNSTNVTIANVVKGLLTFKDVTVYIDNPTYIVALTGKACATVEFINLTINGKNGNIDGAVRYIYNLSITQSRNPLFSNLRYTLKIQRLSVDTYYRPTVVLSSLEKRKFVFCEVKNINNKPSAIEKIWGYGYIKNRWDASTPDYSTFDFYLTNTTYAAPLYLDFRIYGLSQITVSGTITQLSSGETVKVQIFSADKEPLLGDTPNFEQVYTATGTINVAWTPPYAGEWVVRVQAEMNQTTNPVTIQDLQVGAAGGGGTTPTPVEPAFVFVG